MLCCVTSANWMQQSSKRGEKDICIQSPVATTQTFRVGLCISIGVYIIPLPHYPHN